MFTPETPHFFKIILEENIRDRKLGIPLKFWRKYGNSLSSLISLTVPSGDTWHVQLTKSDGDDVWLQNGWQSFVEHYSLKHGHLLVFKYDGSCNFQVLIFDINGTEIEYPYITHIENHKNDEGCQEPYEEEEAEAVTPLQVIHENETPSPQKTRKKSGKPCSRPRKKLKTTQTDNDQRDSEDVSGEKDQQTKVPRERSAFGAKEYDKALQRACNFKSDNPFFVVAMQPSYINPGRKMCIPRDFTTEFLKENLGDITLCTSEGKTWPANYWRYISCNKYTKAILYNGWREFRQDNKLEAGDVCVFELINRTEMLLKVVIYRVGEDSNCYSSLGGVNSSENAASKRSRQRTKKSKHLCSMRPLTPLEKARAILRAGDFKSENPFFKVVMQPAYINPKHRVYIPYKFAETYLNGNKGQVSLQVPDGRTWTLKFSVDVMGSGQHKAQFHNNWADFAQDNNLEVGDVCVFELIDCQKGSFKVSIFSAASDANSSPSPQADDTRASQVSSDKCTIPETEADDDFGNFHVGNSSCVDEATSSRPSPQTEGTCSTLTQPLREGEKIRALLRARTFKSQNPFFIVAMLPSYIRNRLKLTIPMDFSRKYLTEMVGNITLCMPYGKTWMVKCIRESTKNRRAKLTDGWKTFAEDNNLEVNDVCVFEMIKSEGSEFSFSVFIYKAEDDEI